MIKNKISEIITMTETIMYLKSGSITWSVVGKNFDNKKYVCVAFSYNSKEFINVMAPIDAGYNDSIEMVSHILDVNDRLLERSIVVLSTYGLMSLIKSVAEKDTKLMYIANFDIEDSNYQDMVDINNPCLN
jgi:hypothetical protein